jgi:hypothetical protein
MHLRGRILPLPGCCCVQKLALTVCEVKPVHSESMAALDAGISSLVAQLGEQVRVPC